MSGAVEQPGPDDWRKGFLAAVRQFMERRRAPVRINPDARYEWDEVSSFGWVHDEALWHVRGLGDQEPGCAWRMSPDAELVTKTYSQFVDTFHDDKDEVGMNMGPASCACGAYTDLPLRYTGTLGDIIPELLGIAASE